MLKVENSREFDSRRRRVARKASEVSSSKVCPQPDGDGHGLSSVNGAQKRSESKGGTRYRPKWARNRYGDCPSSRVLRLIPTEAEDVRALARTPLH